MADLRAFVETKLLSKSEKTLEKIGTEEPKPLLIQQVWIPGSARRCLFVPAKLILYHHSSQEYHHSLDTGEDHLSRPASALAKIFEHKNEFKAPIGWGNLVKGKSMPSLRYHFITLLLL